MPLTVFDCKGIPATQREWIEAAVKAAGRQGRHLAQPFEAWIAADLPRGGVRLMITGPQGFDRTVTFDLTDDAAVIAERIRETIQD
jgi:hypothetical protein